MNKFDENLKTYLNECKKLNIPVDIDNNRLIKKLSELPIKLIGMLKENVMILMDLE